MSASATQGGHNNAGRKWQKHTRSKRKQTAARTAHMYTHINVHYCNTAQNSSDNLLSYPLDNHHS